MLYATADVRECYALVKKALYRKGVKKVVLILHSQGGIEGGMIVDWLLNEIPQDLLQYLEVYTFGSISNHFNNPYREAIPHPDASSPHNGVRLMRSHERAIRHIEHYANSYDFASRFGVLNFTKKAPENHLENRFMGKVFVNPRSGHQLNQHYLDTIFPLDETNHFTRDPIDGDFMDLNVIIKQSGNDETKPDLKFPRLQLPKLNSAGIFCDPSRNADQETEMRNFRPVLSSRGDNDLDREVNVNRGRLQSKLKTRDLSRLWLYRNGGRP